MKSGDAEMMRTGWDEDGLVEPLVHGDLIQNEEPAVLMEISEFLVEIG